MVPSTVSHQRHWGCDQGTPSLWGLGRKWRPSRQTCSVILPKYQPGEEGDPTWERVLRRSCLRWGTPIFSVHVVGDMLPESPQSHVIHAYYSNSRYSMDLEGGTYQAHGHGVGGACAGMACSLRRGQQVPGHYKACLLPCLTQLGFYYIFSSLPVSLLSHV